MGKKRIAYLDFIKVFAMFIVTIGHCAQSLSCTMFPDKIIPNDLFISIHMPLFMIASGYVLNFDKIRECSFKDYIYNKFSRLIVPMIIYLFIYSVITLSIPNFKSLFVLFWYLSALFFSLITIKLFSMFIKNNVILLVLSLLFVLLIPVYKYSHTNFMFPFLIYGYILRKYIDKLNLYVAFVFGIVFITLYFTCWGLQHTVYLSPLDIICIDENMVYSYLLRFAIGISGSTFLFILFKKIDSSLFIQSISKYGAYTLAFYTMTTVINGFIRRLLVFCDFSIENPFLLDISSIILALAEMFVIYKFALLVEKHRTLSRLLLGN